MMIKKDCSCTQQSFQNYDTTRRALKGYIICASVIFPSQMGVLAAKLDKIVLVFLPE
jgi:hypothetical protein